jgi:hypothetical protein
MRRGTDTGMASAALSTELGSDESKRDEVDWGGKTVVGMIRDLAHVVAREKAKMGLFVTLAEPTDPMRKEALKEGYFETSSGGKFFKLQILTVEDLLDSKKGDIPSSDASAFAKAPEETKQQQKLL